MNQKYKPDHIYFAQLSLPSRSATAKIKEIKPVL